MNVIHMYDERLHVVIAGKTRETDGGKLISHWTIYPVLLRAVKQMNVVSHTSEWVIPIPIYEEDIVTSSITSGLFDLTREFSLCNTTEWTLSGSTRYRRYNKIIRQLVNERGRVLAYWTMGGTEIEIGNMKESTAKHYYLQKGIHMAQKTATAYAADKKSSIQLYRLETITDMI